MQQPPSDAAIKEFLA
jgi:hypothetical protein